MAAARLFTSSLSKMWTRWLFTVRSLILRAAAITLFTLSMVSGLAFELILPICSWPSFTSSSATEILPGAFGSEAEAVLGAGFVLLLL